MKPDKNAMGIQSLMTVPSIYFPDKAIEQHADRRCLGNFADPEQTDLRQQNDIDEQRKIVDGKRNKGERAPHQQLRAIGEMAAQQKHHCEKARQEAQEIDDTLEHRGQSFFSRKASAMQFASFSVISESVTNGMLARNSRTSMGMVQTRDGLSDSSSSSSRSHTDLMCRRMKRSTSGEGMFMAVNGRGDRSCGRASSRRNTPASAAVPPCSRAAAPRP